MSKLRFRFWTSILSTLLVTSKDDIISNTIYRRLVRLYSSVTLTQEMEHRVRNTKYKTHTLEAKDKKRTSKTTLWVHNTMQEGLHSTSAEGHYLCLFVKNLLQRVLKVCFENCLCVMSSFSLLWEIFATAYWLLAIELCLNYDIRTVI